MAAEFHFKSAPTTIKEVNKGNFVMSIPGAASPLSCAAVAGEGSPTKTSGKWITIKTVKRTSCTFAGLSFATVTDTTVEYHSTSTYSMLKTWTIEAPLGGCNVTIEPTNNQELSKMTYTNIQGTNKELEVKAVLSGVTEKSSGAVCGKSGKEAKIESTTLISDPGVDISFS
jgi:hypothetical protein